ncbi:MAG: MBL fold metallo-hydrolase RNA specificity domain-containing protein [Methanomassiliicoccus sp.]|nr:MBL fold metallo-hydrolase RNA specificity domain-containing protein [Methanomassiliicoccus sp.]
MPGRALTIRLGNGVEVLGDEAYYFDADVIEACGTFCISHAHSDHLPKRVVGTQVVASEVTLRCLNSRSKKQLTMGQANGIEEFDAGHMAGSRMFQVEVDGRQVLYTGDLCTRDRCGSKGARPVKTDVLIIESTYGKPRYVFPPSDIIASLVRDEVEDIISQGRPVSLYAYPFGKSQDMLRVLREFGPYADRSVYNATALVRSEDDPLECRLWDGEDPNDPFVVICSPWLNRTQNAEVLRRRNPKRLAVSGWALDSGYRARLGVDEAFPFSDHADFNDLIAFVKACEPEVVITHHGFADSLACEIKARLGIEARPLIRGQRSLLEF